jgi:hypothetical protein
LQPLPASNIDPVGKVADQAYFELEALLDEWRRHGMPEDVVRTALERARRASLAMEDVARRLMRR